MVTTVHSVSHAILYSRSCVSYGLWMKWWVVSREPWGEHMRYTLYRLVVFAFEHKCQHKIRTIFGPKEDKQIPGSKSAHLSLCNTCYASPNRYIIAIITHILAPNSTKINTDWHKFFANDFNREIDSYWFLLASLWHLLSVSLCPPTNHKTTSLQYTNN